MLPQGDSFFPIASPEGMDAQKVGVHGIGYHQLLQQHVCNYIMAGHRVCTTSAEPPGEGSAVSLPIPPVRPILAPNWSAGEVAQFHPSSRDSHGLKENGECLVKVANTPTQGLVLPALTFSPADDSRASQSAIKDVLYVILGPSGCPDAKNLMGFIKGTPAPPFIQCATAVWPSGYGARLRI